jgi:hypothetical protein
LDLGNFLPEDDSLQGKEGFVYRMHGGFCLETQAYPDSINQPNFPQDSVLRPGSNMIKSFQTVIFYHHYFCSKFKLFLFQLSYKFGNLIMINFRSNLRSSGFLQVSLRAEGLRILN